MTFLFRGGRPGGAPISAIRIDYPESDVRIFGRSMHWLVMYTVLSITFAVVLRRPLGVEVSTRNPFVTEPLWHDWPSRALTALN